MFTQDPTTGHRENLHSQILESFSDGLFTLDKQWRYGFINASAAQMVGKTVKDLQGKVIWECFPEAIDTPYFKIYHEVMETGKPQSFDLPYPPLKKWYKGNVYPFDGGITIVFTDETNRKQLEEEIVKSKGLMESIVHSTTSMMVMGLDREYRYLFFNKAHEAEILKVYGQQIKIGDCILDFMDDADDIAKEKAVYDQVLAGEHIMKVSKFGPKDKRRTYEARYNPIRHGTQIGGLTIFAEDVTGRIELQQKVTEAESIINESLSVAFLWKNKEEWPMEYVSENITRITGYTPEELTSGSISYASMIHEEDLERVAEEVRMNSVELGLNDFEHQPYRLVRKDGKVIWVEDSTNVKRNERGEITAYAGLITDITEKVYAKHQMDQLEIELEKRTQDLVASEQALREREARFQNLYEAAGDGLITHDLEGKVLDANNSICQKLGYSKDEFKQMYVFDSHPPAAREKGVESYKQLLKKGQIRLESEFLTKSGEIIHGEVFSKIIDLGDRSIVQSIFKDITEQKKAQEEIFLLKRAIDQSANSILMTDLNGNINYVNDRLCKTTGYSRQELLGNTPNLFRSGMHSREFYDSIWTTIQAGKTWSGDIINKKKDGTLFTESVTIDPVQDAQGTTISYISVKEDVTEKRRIYEELDEACTQLTLATDTAQLGIWKLDVKSGNLTWNDRLHEIYGISKVEFSHNINGWRDKVFPDDLEYADKRFAEILDGKSVFDVEFRVRRSDNDIRYITASGSPIFNEKNELTQLIGINVDITHIRNKDLAIQKSAEKYQFLTDFFPHILWSSNPDGGLTFVNKSGLEMIGATEEQLMDGGWYDVIHPDDRATVAAKWGEATKLGRPYNNEQRILTTDGFYTWFKVTASPHRNETGEIDQWVGLSTNIQAEKEYLERVQENERRLQRIFDSISDGYISYDQTGKILSINRAGKELLGLDVKEFKDTLPNIVDFYPDKASFARETELFIDHRIQNQIVEFIKPNEEAIVLDFNKVRFNRKNGGAYHVEASFREVSEKFSLNRLLNASLALHERAETATYEELVQIGVDACERLLDSKIAFFHLVNDDQDTIRLTQWSTETKKHCEVPYLEGHYPIRQAGNWVDCVETKAPVIHNDYATAPNKKGLPDGHIHLFRDLEVPILEDGKVKAIIGVGNKKVPYTPLDARQITAFGSAFWAILRKKKADEELESNQFFLEKAQLVGNIGTWTVDLKDVSKNWWSDSMKLIHGLNPEDPAPNLDYYQRVDPKDVAPLQEAFQHASETGQYEFTYGVSRYSDGKHIVLESTSEVLRDENDEPRMHVGITQDITERYELEQQLIDTNNKLSAIVDSIPGAVFNCKWDDYYSMNFISPYIEKITGYGHEEFYPAGPVKFADIVHEADQSKLNTDLASAFQDGLKYITNYRLIAKDGTERWVMENGAFDKTQTHEGVVNIDGVIIDITDKMEAEDQMLQETYKAEDRTRREISQEIHDGLQQSLITSKLNLDSVMKESMVLSKSARDRLKTGMDYLSRSITETRAIAHVLMPKAIKDFGLVTAVENLIDNLHSDVTFHITENLNSTRLPKELELGLFRIIQESISNIMKYSQAPEAFIQINHQDDKINLTIEDEGVGFDYDKVTKNNNGLGLMSMKSRVSALKGYIEIHSEPGGGTLILVEIPLSQNK